MARRRWFQFHLKTAIVTMILIGAIFTLNFSGQRSNEYKYQDSSDRIHVIKYGWPV